MILKKTRKKSKMIKKIYEKKWFKLPDLLRKGDTTIKS